MRVLFLGTTGVNKQEVMTEVANIACKEKFQLPSGLNHPDAHRHIQIFDLDNRIKSKAGLAYTAIMDAKMKDKQQAIWQAELESILEEIEQKQPEHVFLAVHASYYRYNNYFSMLDMSMLARFHPNVIVTLIDDIYDVSHKVMEKEKNFKTNSSCTLSEALGWRTIEIMMSDFIAGHLFVNPSSVNLTAEDFNNLPLKIRKLFSKNIPHFVVAVKHDRRMIYRLLFERKRLVLYSSFPITSTRTVPVKLDEINKFKSRLREKFTVFDPATIDEYVVREKESLGSEIKQIRENGMIARDDGDYILLQRLYDDYPRNTELPYSLNPKELIEISNAITKQVENRDYRLIDQSNGVVAYRPFWGNRPDPSGGVDAELEYANNTGKAMIAYHPSEDGDPKQLFKGVENAIKHNSLDDLFTQLEEWQKQHNDQVQNDTWED